METVSRTRAALLAWFVALLGAAIAARLVVLQVIEAPRLRALARRQHEQVVEIGGQRGAILDRSGHELAVSVATSSLFAHPARVQDPARAARLLSPLVGLPESKILERLRSDAPFVWLARRLDPRTTKAIEGLALPLGKGKPLGFEEEGRRFYPQGDLAVHVIGYANIDQKGLEGIEKICDETLQGLPAKYLAVRDGRGGAVLQLVQPASKPARDVVLTLDLALQNIVERELDRGFQESGARAGAAILLDPSTGQILALANRPTADPNRYADATIEGRRNRAVVDIYEPGSTFKVITAAAALDAGTVTPERIFDCQNGTIVLAGKPVRDVHPYGALTVRQIVEKSSNVGIIKVSRTMPREVFRSTVVRFGFGGRSGIELPGERPGQVTPISRMSGVSPQYMAMGYEIAVTALQMASAVAAVANDGVLVPPRIVLGTRDASGNFEPSAAPEPRRVISSRTAATLAGILEGVVVHGTGTQAVVPGYRIAGKTGTARKIIPGQGYARSQFIASFVGFGPIRSPRLAGIVVMDSPSKGGYYGGVVSAPVLGRILADALTYLRVPPDEDPLSLPDKPNPRGSRAARERIASKSGPARDREDDGAETAEPPVVTSQGQVPDVRRMSLRQAIAALSSRGYRASVLGSGVVREQFPAAGTPLEPGGTCAVSLGAEPAPDEDDATATPPPAVAAQRRPRARTAR